MRTLGQIFNGALCGIVCTALGCWNLSGQRRPRVDSAVPVTANWRDRDSTVVFEKLFLPASPLDAFVVVYGSPGGDPGTALADTITYLLPASGVLHVKRLAPVPWAETHLYQSASGATTEIPVAADCAVVRKVNRRYPNRVFGCWMPVVVSGKKVPDPYMAVALSDSAGLEGAWTHAIALINTELFAGHLDSPPYWVEPPAMELNQ